MAQASVLTDGEIRRIFRIIETTRHAERNRLTFTLSIVAGLRVGEIAALTLADVANHNGEARREIKLAPHQTKGAKSRTVVLSNRVRAEISDLLADHSQAPRRSTADCIATEWSPVHQRQSVHAVQGNLRDGRTPHVISQRQKNVRNSPQRSRRGDENYTEVDGSQAHRYNRALLRGQ
jgi:integrase